MEPFATGQQVTDRDHEAVHDWRVTQLMRLGIPGTLAEVYADRIDWHQIARLVRGGCPARLALRIVRGNRRGREWRSRGCEAAPRAHRLAAGTSPARAGGIAT